MLANDQLALAGEYRIVRVDFRREIERSINGRPAAAPPCMHLPHRDGICPHGLRHDVTVSEGQNTILTSLKESVIDQMEGTATPTNLLITRISYGTSADPTTAGMVDLVAEYGRATPELVKVSALALRAFWFLGPTDGNAPSTLQEWGIVAGGGTDTLGSGVTIARFLDDFAKDSLTTCNGQYDYSIA